MAKQKGDNTNHTKRKHWIMPGAASGGFSYLHGLSLVVFFLTFTAYLWFFPYLYGLSLVFFLTVMAYLSMVVVLLFTAYIW